jgi:hypothetical protein
VAWFYGAAIVVLLGCLLVVVLGLINVWRS